MQIFHRSANTIFKLSIFGSLLVVGGLLYVMNAVESSSWVTRQDQIITQPVQFSHARHVGGNGIDCRYCHTSVETSAFAGIPPTKTCMNCHSEIFSQASYLRPVRASFRTNVSLHWNRVHDLPDFVYFNHSIHVNKGIGCSTCHGRVDQMPLVVQVQSLQMQWCLNCHRHPERYVRPRADVFRMDYAYPTDQVALGKRLVAEYHIKGPADLTSCSTCHR
ncbi:MAG TPA: cytochrome c3 family protein [Vicinamibacterales bacterium]|nr:cytochrome c3 family protein [Vicinamibacterales bacterium]